MQTGVLERFGQACMERLEARTSGLRVQQLADESAWLVHRLQQGLPVYLNLRRRLVRWEKPAAFQPSPYLVGVTEFEQLVTTVVHQVSRDLEIRVAVIIFTDVSLLFFLLICAGRAPAFGGGRGAGAGAAAGAGPRLFGARAAGDAPGPLSRQRRRHRPHPGLVAPYRPATPLPSVGTRAAFSVSPGKKSTHPILLVIAIAITDQHFVQHSSFHSL